MSLLKSYYTIIHSCRVSSTVIRLSRPCISQTLQRSKRPCRICVLLLPSQQAHPFPTLSSLDRLGSRVSFGFSVTNILIHHCLTSGTNMQTATILLIRAGLVDASQLWLASNWGACGLKNRLQLHKRSGVMR